MDPVRESVYCSLLCSFGYEPKEGSPDEHFEGGGEQNPQSKETVTTDLMNLNEC